MRYEDFDYLCNEPFYFEGIGYLKCPTLRDIRKITYQMFSVLSNMAVFTINDYLKATNMVDKYNELSEDEKRSVTLYGILVQNNPQILVSMISFFTCGKIEVPEKSSTFVIYNDNNEKIGHIGEDNFEDFRVAVKSILGLSSSKENEPKKFKNDIAKKMYERMQKNDNGKPNDVDENYSLDNMIRKYCTHNKVGINILNVWDLTYYQFVAMFKEYCNGRKCDINDSIATNTLTFKNSTDYKPLEYIQKITK